MPAIHQGSWSIFGQRLPDIGLTEKVGALLGRPTTAQGGSNIIGGAPKAAAPVSGASTYQAPKVTVPSGVGSSTGGGTYYSSNTGAGNPTPATSGQPGGGDSGGGYDYIGALRSAFGQSRDALTSMLPTYDSDLSNFASTVNKGVEAARSTLNDQNATDEKLYGQNLKQLLQSDQEAGKRRYGTYSALGSLDSSQYQDDTTRAQQALLDRQGELTQQKSQQFNDRQREFSNYENEANSKVAAYTNEIARAKQSLAQAVANSNIDEAGQIQNYISTLQNQQYQLQSAREAAGLNLAQLQAQGTNVLGNLSKMNMGAFSNLFGQNLANSLQQQIGRYSIPAGSQSVSGYIGSGNLSDQQKKLLAAQGINI